MKTTILKISFIFLLLSLMGAGCEKDEKSDKQSITITLHDKPLTVIQLYIKGKWKLQYSYGGLITKKNIDTHNSYLTLSPDHITVENDAFGAVVDTNIVWVRDKAGFNDSTYLLSYTRSGYPSPEYYIVDQIKQDTLILIDYNVSDGFYYYYTKN